jgi:hypothetical protein
MVEYLGRPLRNRRGTQLHKNLKVYSWEKLNSKRLYDPEQIFNTPGTKYSKRPHTPEDTSKKLNFSLRDKCLYLTLPTLQYLPIIFLFRRSFTFFSMFSFFLIYSLSFFLFLSLFFVSRLHILLSKWHQEIFGAAIFVHCTVLTVYKY